MQKLIDKHIILLDLIISINPVSSDLYFFSLGYSDLLC